MGLFWGATSMKTPLGAMSNGRLPCAPEPSRSLLAHDRNARGGSASSPRIASDVCGSRQSVRERLPSELRRTASATTTAFEIALSMSTKRRQACLSPQRMFGQLRSRFGAGEGHTDPLDPHSRASCRCGRRPARAFALHIDYEPRPTCFRRVGLEMRPLPASEGPQGRV